MSEQRQQAPSEQATIGATTYLDGDTSHTIRHHPEGRTKYYNHDANEISTDICVAAYPEMGPGVYTMADGKPWDETWPHCSDNIYRVSHFTMPQWLEHGKTYTFLWQWYSGVGLNSEGEMTQPMFTTHEPEGAYFGQCIEVIMKTAEECGSAPDPTTKAPQTTAAPTTQAPTTTPSSSCPVDTPCQFAGTNSTCGQRINWLKENRGMNETDAGNLVAQECAVCQGCGSTTTAAPTTQAPTTTTTAPSSSCPLETNCLYAGWNSTCGQRIDWLKKNRGMNDRDAGNQVAEDCPVCQACGSNVTTKAPVTKAPTPPPGSNNKCYVCYWNCQDQKNWQTKTGDWDNASAANCKQTTGGSSCYCYGSDSVKECYDSFNHRDGTSCSADWNLVI